MKLPHRRQFLHLAAGAAALPAVSRIAFGQAYPSRPVRVVVPYAPGGPTDLFGRLIAQKLSEHLGKQFYVENISGANGNIGMGRAANAAADGYTILIVSPSYTTNPTLYNNVPYDPYKDFEPIAVAVTKLLLVIINRSVQARTVKDLMALIEANPGKYNYATGGTGSAAPLVANNSAYRSVLTLCTFRTTALAWQLARWWRVMRRFSSARPHPPPPQIREGKFGHRPGPTKSRGRTQRERPPRREVVTRTTKGRNRRAV